jgi:sec-independent protein translocase protein TatA
MLGLGMQELVIIFLIIMVLFGASRLPEIGSGIGKAIRNFKKATSEQDEIDVTPKKPVEDAKSEKDNTKDSA